MGKKTVVTARVPTHEHRLLKFVLWMLNALALLLASTLFAVTGCVLLLLQACSLGIEYGTAASIGGMLTCLLMAAAGLVTHELGHLVAAWIVRWRVLQVMVGPFIWERQGDQFKLRFSSKRSSPWGHVVAIPTDFKGYYLRAGIVYSGGILANSLFALVCLIVLLARHAPLNTFSPRGQRSIFHFFLVSHDVVTALVQAALVMNLLYAVIGLIPQQFRKFTSDGGLLLGLLLSKRQVSELTFLVRPGLGGTLFRGSRPREWDGEAVQRLLQTAKTPLEKADALLCAYYRALDRGQVEEAGALLEQALPLVDELKGNTRSAILVEAAYFEGFHRRNAAVARKRLHQAAVRELEEQTFLRAASAVLLAEGLFAEAAASAEAALEKAEQSLDHGGALAEKEWLRAIGDTCRERCHRD